MTVIEQIMNSHVIGYYIIDHVKPSKITIEYSDRADFGNSDIIYM